MDIEFLLALQSFRDATGGVLNSLFLFITTFGEEIVATMLICAVFWCFNKRAGEHMILTLGIGRAVLQFAKLTACVYRPWIRDARIEPVSGGKTTATGYSFPSGHSMTATSVWGCAAAELKGQRMLRGFAVAIIALVMFSRLYIGVHTPQDVLVGCTLGVVMIIITNFLLKWIDKGGNRDIIVVAVVVAICAGLAVYFALKPYPIDYAVDGSIIVDPAKMQIDGFKDVGSAIGFMVGWLLERRFVRFDPATVVSWSGKLKRFLPGAVVIIILITASKPFFNLFLDPRASAVISAILIALFITLIYPAIFKAVAASRR